jgi:DNA-binding Lrp family transcriptional regulator
MSGKLDELDLKIIRKLQVNGRASVTELAEEVGSSRPTVTSRLHQLLESKIITIKGGLNLRRLSYKVALVGLEVRTDEARKEIEAFLRNCPRVLNIFRTSEKANLLLNVWGEDDQTINSTIESFGDQRNASIVYAHYLGTPIHGDVIINAEAKKSDETPCGTKCSECHRYQKAWCRGCPSSSDYRPEE